MKGENLCPDCGNATSTVKLGDEPPREVCGRFGCEWDGITLRNEKPAQHTNSDGAVVME